MIKKAVRSGLLPGLCVSVVILAALLIPAGSALASAFCYAYPGCAIYTTDAYGPLHPDGGSPPISNYPNFSSPLVRAAHPAPGSVMDQTGLELDAYGGLHAFGTPALTIGQEPYFPGLDIARDFVFLPSGTGGYELDGYGGIHPFSIGANALPPQPGQYPYYPGKDLAKKITILSTGTGGYELDAYGGVHPWSAVGGALPAQISEAPYYPNNNIARDLWLDPASTAAASSGYELDGFGGFHPWWAGTAAAPATMAVYPYYPGLDIARIMWFQPGASSAASNGYQLDGYGGIHPFAANGVLTPPAISPIAYWPGRDIAKALFGA